MRTSRRFFSLHPLHELYLILVLTGTLAAQSTFAQSTLRTTVIPVTSSLSENSAQSMPLPSDKQALILGSGDQISIRVQDMEELSDKPIRIDADGEIDLPMIGRVHAAGLTLREFKALLSVKLGRYITDPQIAISLVDNQSRPVSVVGEVNAPGVHQLVGPRSLIEMLSAAGGVKPTAGSQVILTRQIEYGELPLAGAKRDPSGRFSTATLSLDELLSAKAPANNIGIRPNDVISIPRGDVVYVVGDVRRAGGFPLASHSSITLLQALSLAEGLGPDAATQKAKILRPVAGGDGTPKEIPVDVKSIFAGKSPDVRLFAEDILFIPNSAAKSGAHRAAEAILQVATGVAIYAR